MKKVHFILYVSDQRRSTAFYTSVLETDPILEVPGMTEFALPGGAVLGLMPNTGVKKLLGSAIRDPSEAQDIPRAELYLIVDDPQRYLDRAGRAGGCVLSAIAPRDWGHRAGYVADPDGHVLAFADLDESS